MHFFCYKSDQLFVANNMLLYCYDMLHFGVALRNLRPDAKII